MSVTLNEQTATAETEDTVPAERKIQDLAMVAGKLIEVMKRENAALKTGSFSDINVLIDEKTALARIFESRIQGLTAKDADLSGVDAELRDKAREVMERVQALTEENGRRLRTAIAANKRVVELIQSAVKDARPGPSVYSASGQKGYAQRPAQQARGMAISFDSVL